MPNLNPSLHLQSLGWAGPGHPLNPNAYKQKGSRGLAYDPTSTSGSNNNNNSSAYFAAGGNGLIRPLLVSKKEGNLGLGRRAHEPQKGNEWWLKGFEAALKKDHSTSAEGSWASTPRGGADELQRSVNVQAGRFGGLYGFFVKGETVGGTIGLEEEGEQRVGKTGKKRKSDVLDGPQGDESGDLDAGKKRKKSKRRNSVNGEDAQQDFGQIAAFMSVRDKSERKKAKERRKLRESEQFRVAGEWLGLKEGCNGEKKSTRLKVVDETNGAADDDDDDQNTGAVKEPQRSKDSKKRRIITDSNGVTREETKEERRHRRAAKRERKEREKMASNGKVKSVAVKRLLDSGTATPTTVATTSAATSDDEEDEDDTDEMTAKQRRKEERRERRRRKGEAA